MLYAQPTVSHGDLRDIVHHEILTRMIDAEGSHLSIARLIPLAEQMGLMPELDRLILEQLLEVPIQSLQPQRVAINLSPLSLESGVFMDWFASWLERCGTLGLALNFEFPEFRPFATGPHWQILPSSSNSRTTAWASTISARAGPLWLSQIATGLCED